jgi:hypothetical protein
MATQITGRVICVLRWLTGYRGGIGEWIKGPLITLILLIMMSMSCINQLTVLIVNNC